MSAKEFWLEINKTGKLNAKELEVFLKFVNIDLESSEIEELVAIFDGTITYCQFKQLLKLRLK
jgi:Ca2+-binding EF-hand superfamily protein